MTAAATSSWAFRLLFVNRRFYTLPIKRRNQERVIISPCLSLWCALSQGPPLKIAPFCYDSGIMISVSGVTAARVFSNPSLSPSLSPGIRSLNRLRSSSERLVLDASPPRCLRQSSLLTPRSAPGVELWSEKVIKWDKDTGNRWSNRYCAQPLNCLQSGERERRPGKVVPLAVSR